MHTHNTRHCTANNFYIQYSRLNRHNESFVKLRAKIWNNISDNVREFGKNKFTKTIHKTLLTILKLEDDYVGVPTLIQLMAKQLNYCLVCSFPIYFGSNYFPYRSESNWLLIYIIHNFFFI
jgi:hypothetical protein